MNRFNIAVAAALLWRALADNGLAAEAITLPNASFETPATGFVNVNLNSWQKSPKPAWYDESGGFLWTQLSGLFANTPATSADHIDNCDGNQVLWLFADREVGLFQDYDSTDWAHPAPMHAFDKKFEVGSSYALTVGVIGGGGNMFPGATLEISLYYRDAASNRVTVAATSITNTPAIFSNTTHLVDFQAVVPPVLATNAWAGRHIGVQIRSTITDTNLEGGYWDIDNVRLARLQPPAWTGVKRTDDGCVFTLQSEPGLKFEILTATNLTAPATNWTSLGSTFTNLTGSAPVSVAPPTSHARFYRARQLP